MNKKCAVISAVVIMCLIVMCVGSIFLARAFFQYTTPTSTEPQYDCVVIVTELDICLVKQSYGKKIRYTVMGINSTCTYQPSECLSASRIMYISTSTKCNIVNGCPAPVEIPQPPLVPRDLQFNGYMCIVIIFGGFILCTSTSCFVMDGCRWRWRCWCCHRHINYGNTERFPRPDTLISMAHISPDTNGGPPPPYIA
jgi:hypothetical protein